MRALLGTGTEDGRYVVGCRIHRRRLDPHERDPALQTPLALRLTQLPAHPVNDRRRVEVHLLPAGETVLTHLAAIHRAELRAMQGVFTIPNLP